MKKFYQSIPYLLSLTLILGWWGWAFHEPKAEGNPWLQPTASRTHELLSFLSPWDRSTLMQALAGDTHLMQQYLLAWEKDAKALIDIGVKEVQMIPSEELFQTYLLGHLQNNAPHRHLYNYNRLLAPEANPEARLLPQSYAAASMLLAMVPSNQISAVPQGIKGLSPLFPQHSLQQFPNTEDCKGEKLYLAKPDLAFVAQYSHPPTLAMLRSQRVRLMMIQDTDTIDGILNTLLSVGQASGHPIESSYLARFVHAALLAIDNRLLALDQLVNQSDQFRTMRYLCYHHHNLSPTSRSLTGQLLKRTLRHHKHLHCSIPTSQLEWRLPCEQEELIEENADCLLLAVQQRENSLSQWLEAHPGMQRTHAVQHQQVYLLDEMVQEFPSQYLVLAYFDIYQALATAQSL